MAQKKVTLLGSTGSIGTQALEVIDRHRDELAVEALVFGTNIRVAVEQALRFRPRDHLDEEEEDMPSVEPGDGDKIHHCEYDREECGHGPEG